MAGPSSAVRMHGSVPVSPNLLERQFTVEARNEVWVSDITYLWTRQGWMYLAVIIDLFSRRVVGWSLSDRMTADLVCNALDSAVSRRQPEPGLVFHSDRGSQYASRAFRRRLWRYRMVQSMSRKGNCWDNAVAESFFATEERARARLRLRIASSGAQRGLRIHRGLLQPAARSLGAELRDANELRGLH